jgi:hypothetical protein
MMSSSRPDEDVPAIWPYAITCCLPRKSRPHEIERRPWAELQISHLAAITNTEVTTPGQVVTVLINGTPSELTCTVTASTTCRNESAVVTVPTGSFLRVRVEGAAGGTAKAWLASFLVSGTGA